MHSHKKALVFVTNKDYMALEEARIRENDGYEIFFVVCDKSIGVCHPNSYCSKLMCRFCSHSMMKLIKPLLQNPHYHCINISSLISNSDVTVANNMTFSYSTVKELKDIVYHDVEIGFGAFSTYVSVSRDVMPDFTKELREYLDYVLRSEVMMTLAIERYINSLMPDLIVLHNGRFSNVKPFLCLAKKNNINFITTETRCGNGGVMLKNNFFNDIPHSFLANKEKTEYAWKKCGRERGLEIGRSFFYNRLNSKPAGDKIYTKDQKVGKLPDDFDSSKTNITIFNSSEDEFFSISKEYDSSVLFPNQYEALHSIFDHYKDDDKIHFYLRIHPNLAQVHHKSHLALYDLKYSNVTIVPPKSKISSYALMENSKIVIVFNSTIGLESSYWNKPVISLGTGSYTPYNIVYQPRSENEVYEMIDTPNLTSLRNEEACCKLACFLMGYGTDDFKYYKVVSKIEYFMGRPINTYSCFKIANSPKLHRLFELAMMSISLFNPVCRRFYKLAQ